MNPSSTGQISLMARTVARSLRRFCVANDGLAAVEFAMLAPLMIVTYFGVTEITDSYVARTKVTTVASTAADLVAQEKAVCNAEMNDVFAALSAIMFPYPVNSMQIIVSSIVDAGNGTYKVAWSDAQNANARTVNSIVSVPSGLVSAGGSVILSEVTYNYTSPAGHMITGSLAMTDKFYLRPRRTVQITRSANSC
jgi:Flp pilus assembly protein TadG